MTEADRTFALQRLERARRVQSMIELLEDLLAGRVTRAQVRPWMETNWPARRDAKLHGEANSISSALWNLDDRDSHGRPFVGEPELRAYLGMLRRGEPFVGTGEALVRLTLDVDAFAARIGAEPIHWMDDSLGWTVELRFAARASGRPFVAHADAHQRDVLGICVRRGDSWRDALIELFEELEIDEHDVSWLHPEVELTQLPEWALWRVDDNANRFEVERSRCFAKLDRKEQTLRDRGHKQMYWVDPVE